MIICLSQKLISNTFLYTIAGYWKLSTKLFPKVKNFDHSAKHLEKMGDFELTYQS